MSVIVENDTARNLTNTSDGSHLVVDPTERQFLTYINELGAVHTIIVDTEHVAKDGEELLKWFEHTRAAVTLLSHLSPKEVLERADRLIGASGQPAASEQGDHPTEQEAGA